MTADTSFAAFLAETVKHGAGYGDAFLPNAAAVSIRPDALPTMQALLDRHAMHDDLAAQWARCADSAERDGDSAKAERAQSNCELHRDGMSECRKQMLRKLELTFGAGMGEGIAKVLADA